MKCTCSGEYKEYNSQEIGDKVKHFCKCNKCAKNYTYKTELKKNPKSNYGKKKIEEKKWDNTEEQQH